MLLLKGVGVQMLERLVMGSIPVNCASSFTLNWTPAGLGAYELERKLTTALTWTLIYTGTNNSYLDSGLAQGTYEYRVRLQGESDYSNVVNHYVEPAGIVLPGYVCVGVDKYQKVTNGSCSYVAGSLLQANSPDCGYVPPPVGVCAGTNFTNACNVIAVKFAVFDMGVVNTSKICADFECTFHNGPGGVTIKVDGVQVAEQTNFGSVIPRQVVSFTGTFNGHVHVTAVSAGTSNAGNGTAKLYEVSWA